MITHTVSLDFADVEVDLHVLPPDAQRAEQRDNWLALDLWEMADRFGEERLIPFGDWVRYFYRGVTPEDAEFANAKRRWARLADNLRGSSWPVGQATYIPAEQAFEKVDSESPNQRAWGLGLYLYRGTRATLARILDDRVREDEEEAALAALGRLPRATGLGVPQWALAAVRARRHHEIECPVCKAPEGLVCVTETHATSFHPERLQAALLAPEG